MRPSTLLEILERAGLRQQPGHPTATREVRPPPLRLPFNGTLSQDEQRMLAQFTFEEIPVAAAPPIKPRSRKKPMAIAGAPPGQRGEGGTGKTARVMRR